jgi:ubiquinone/menaquinone biosynthesis C-methylase UbiE
MPTERQVYQEYAEQYERLVEREDYQNNILKAVKQVCPLNGLKVIDIGAGTGRLTRILAPHVNSIRAFDLSSHMLAKARFSLQVLNLASPQIAVADHRHIPVLDSCADLVISGWSFCYLAVWGGELWKAELEAGYQEIKRILHPGGVIIFFETLGTGQESPNPPEHLSAYFHWLTEKGFHSTWIRTDYRFHSIQEAVQLSSFFFGKQMEEEVKSKNRLILPECTGVWWKKFHDNETSG